MFNSKVEELSLSASGEPYTSRDRVGILNLEINYRYVYIKIVELPTTT